MPDDPQPIRPGDGPPPATGPAGPLEVGRSFGPGQAGRPGLEAAPEWVGFEDRASAGDQSLAGVPDVRGSLSQAPVEADCAEPSQDPLGAALSDGYRHLGMRDRTEAEIRSCLTRRGHEPAISAQAVEELRRQGYLDDARFARRFAEDRRALDGWGAGRIRSRLAELGVPGELIDAAATSAPEEELEAAVDLLRRRLARAPDGERERRRALGLLVRRGFELELAYDAIRRLEREAA